MVDAGWGRIVNLTSAASLHPPGPMNSAYGTAKAALNQFTRHLAAELAGTGVTANVLHPGDVKTEMWADIRDRVDGRRSRLADGLPAVGALGRRDRWRPAAQGRRRCAARCATTPRRTSPGSSAGSTIRCRTADPELGHWSSTSGPWTRRRTTPSIVTEVRRRDSAGRRRTCSALISPIVVDPDQGHRSA